MNINYKQPQFELFPAHSATLEDINKPKFLLAKLTLSVESLVIVAILAIMIALFAFSLGVERGKHIAAQAMDERVAVAWNVGARTVAQPVTGTDLVRGTQGSSSVLRSVWRQRLIPRPLFKPVQVPVGIRFTLQLATYGNQEYARADALVLRAKGFPSFLIKTGQYWLLCVGSFSNRENADRFLRKLPGQYRSSQIRPFSLIRH